MRVLILEHEPEAPPALLGEWADARGHEQTVALPRDLHSWPDPRGFDAVISLGSESSVHAQPHAWVQPELELLAAAHAHDIPVLGICFGGQAVARALGAHVGFAAEPEVCWREIDTNAPGLVMPGPWFCWHMDKFATPAGARLISGAESQTMAFAIGRTLALQYHPEVDAALVRSWLDGDREKLSRHGVDADEVREQTAQHASGARERAFEQFDRIEAWWSGSSSLDASNEATKETR